LKIIEDKINGNKKKEAIDISRSYEYQKRDKPAKILNRKTERKGEEKYQLVIN
jgi:hypothetical protein